MANIGKSQAMRSFFRQHWFVYLAAIFALVLCLELVLDQYSSKSPTFLSGYVRRGIEYAFLNGMYLIWLINQLQQYRSIQSQAQAFRFGFQNFSDLVKAGLIFLIAAWISYPATSDVYLYLHYGVMGLNGSNPYLIPAKDFTSQLSPLLSWFQTSTYGPISLGLFMIAGAGSFISIHTGIYILKTLFLLIHLLNSYLIWNEPKPTSARSFITLAYLINPIILFEQVGNARVDVLVCTVLILLVRFLRQGRYVGSILVTWAGIFSKTLPIIWLPLVGVFLIRLKRWKALAISAFLSTLFLFILSKTLLTEPEAWISLSNPGVKWQTAGSVHDILNTLLSFFQPVLPSLVIEKQAGVIALFKTFTYLLYGFYYIWVCFKAYFNREYTASNLSVDLGWATLMLFLFATPWYQPWYATVLLCFVALLNFRASFFCLTAIVYAVCSTVAYYLLAGAPEQVPLFIASIITVVPTTLILLFRSKLIFSEAEPSDID